MTTRKRIFITGASGCVGHYLIKQCLEHNDLDIHAFLRSPEKLHPSLANHERVTLHVGDMEHIEKHKAIIETVDMIIHAATIWGGGGLADLINVEKTKELFLMSSPERCKRIVYFSTASILGKGNKTVTAARDYGSDYVRSKYLAHEMIQTLDMKDRITTVFPTLVFGGNNDFPQSHITSGLLPSKKYLNILRFIYTNGGFHFLHADDIAKVALHLAMHPHDQSEYALGTAALSVKEALEVLCTAFKKKPWFRIKVHFSFILFLATLFRIEVGPWERYCMENPDMIFDVVSPQSFGIDTSFPNLEAVVKDIQNGFPNR